MKTVYRTWTEIEGEWIPEEWTDSYGNGLTEAEYETITTDDKKFQIMGTDKHGHPTMGMLKE